jgi:hypothetical protein
MKCVQDRTDFRVIWASICKRQIKLAVLSLIVGQVNALLFSGHSK